MRIVAAIPAHQLTIRLIGLGVGKVLVAFGAVQILMYLFCLLSMAHQNEIIGIHPITKIVLRQIGDLFVARSYV